MFDVDYDKYGEWGHAPNTDADADLITNAPDDLEYLLAEVERLGAALRNIERNYDDEVSSYACRILDGDPE
jgi:hypothetical protein